MTKSQIIRCIAFLLAVCCMMLLLCTVFEQGHGSYADRCFHSYRELEKDTIDAVFIGTSGVSCYWISALGYEEQGITMYPLASDGMPSWLYIEMIEEALTYQNPQLILLDIRPFTSEQLDPDVLDARARTILDAMSFFSANRFKTALKTMDVLHSLREDSPRWDISYLINFIKYHSRWSEEDYSLSYQLDTAHHEQPYGGFFLDYDFTGVVREIPPHRYDSTLTAELDPLHEKALYELLDYIRENELNVLFVDTPKILPESVMRLTNQVYRILEAEGFNYLTFLTTAEDGSFSIDLDLKKDFFNSHHVNYYGAQKFSHSLAAYLKENYALPDRRSDPRVQKHWDGMYDFIQETMKDVEERTIEMNLSESSNNTPSGD